MKTAPLVVAVISTAVVPVVLTSFGCNKKEDAPPPMPSATVAVAATAPAAATAAPIAPPLAPSQQIPLIKTTIGVRTDAGTVVAKNDAALATAGTDAATTPTVNLPPGMPTIAIPTVLPPASALPGLASSVVGGIIQNLPPPIIPPPNPSK
jgi:hypothetical protein